jgi:hypothetical protein
MTGLRRRLARLEAAGEAQDAARDGALVVLPAGLAAEDADRFIEEHRERTGWDGTVVVLPSNGREARPHPAPVHAEVLAMIAQEPAGAEPATA